MTQANGWNEDQLFSSDRQDWATPRALFDALDSEFSFALDAAASTNNAKCENYITKEEDSLGLCWHSRVPCSDSSIWLNPPYGRDIGKWIKKAYEESLKGMTVVVLTFCRSDTKWWHRWAMKACEVRLIEGRVRFEGATASAPAPSCLLVFNESKRLPTFTVVNDLPRR